MLDMKAATRVFRALADPTRRQILQELKAGELAAGQISALFPISGPSISLPTWSRNAGKETVSSTA
jgi:DNA-binding transcriptional ArsR family regulator